MDERHPVGKKEDHQREAGNQTLPTLIHEAHPGLIDSPKHRPEVRTRALMFYILSSSANRSIKFNSLGCTDKWCHINFPTRKMMSRIYTSGLQGIGSSVYELECADTNRDIVARPFCNKHKGRDKVGVALARPEWLPR